MNEVNRRMQQSCASVYNSRHIDGATCALETEHSTTCIHNAKRSSASALEKLVDFVLKKLRSPFVPTNYDVTTSS